MHEIVCAIGTLNFQRANIPFNNVEESISNSIKANVYMLHNRNHNASVFKIYIAVVWLECLILRVFPVAN